MSIKSLETLIQDLEEIKEIHHKQAEFIQILENRIKKQSNENTNKRLKIYLDLNFVNIEPIKIEENAISKQ